MPLGIDAREDAVKDLAVGLVLALALLVLHHATLLVQLVLRDGAEQVPHAVRLHPQRHVQRRLRHVLEIVGPVEICRTVHVGSTDQFERLEVLVIVIFRTVKHQVLVKVCETGLATFFILRADVIPDVYCDDRCFIVLMDNQSQTVIQRVFGEIDVDFGGSSVDAKKK